MIQLWIVVGVLAAVNYAIFNGGVEYFEDKKATEQNGVVEIYDEAPENSQQKIEEIEPQTKQESGPAPQ